MILKSGGCIDGSEILANIIVKKLGDKTGRNYSMTLFLLLFNALVYMTIITQDPDGIIYDIKNKLNKTCTIMKEIISTHSGSFSTVLTNDEILR